MKEEVKVTVQPNQEETAASYSDLAFQMKLAGWRRFILNRVTQQIFEHCKQSFL